MDENFARTSSGKKLAQPFRGDVCPGITVNPLKGGLPDIAAVGLSICESWAIKEKPQRFIF